MIGWFRQVVHKIFEPSHPANTKTHQDTSVLEQELNAKKQEACDASRQHTLTSRGAMRSSLQNEQHLSAIKVTIHGLVDRMKESNQGETD